MGSRVLMFSTPDGGIGQYSYCLCDALTRKGIAVDALVYDSPAYDLARLPHAHTVRPAVRMPASRWTPLQNLALFSQAMRRADVFHSQWNIGPRFDRANWGLLKRRGKKIVYTAHDVLPHERAPEDLDHNVWMYRNADALIVHGDALKKTILELSGVAPDKVHVIPHGNFNPIADHFHKWSRESARASFGLGDDEQVILFFGYVRPYKGLDTLIDACAEVRRRRPATRLRLLIAGRTLGNFWDAGNYAARIDAAGLAGATTYAIEYVPMEDVARYFLAADIVALPYKSGSQSGVLQMAHSYARPAVVTAVGSIGEAVRDGENGLITPPDDPRAFAEALLLLLDDPTRAQCLGRQGRVHSETVLSWDRIAARTARVYTSVREDR